MSSREPISWYTNQMRPLFDDIKEGDYNELFWRVKLNPALFKHLGIYFNSFILENKENKPKPRLVTVEHQICVL